MAKSSDAFRTISEVAEWLDTPAHVLRFWESKFTQVKPVKRAGGRRYYRPQDMRVLGGIKKLLHEEGMTIKGVQRLLREEGVKHVAALSQPLPGEDEQPHPARPEAVMHEAPPAAAPRETPHPEAPPAQAEPEAPPAQAEPEAGDTPAVTPELRGEAPPEAGDEPFAPTSAPEPPAPPSPTVAPEASGAAQTEACAPREAPLAAPEAAPIVVDVPPDPDDTAFVSHGLLSMATALPRPLTGPVAEAVRPFRQRLRKHLQTMSQEREI